MHYLFPTVIVLTVQYFDLCEKISDLLYSDCLTVIVFKLGSFSRHFRFLNCKFMSPIIKTVFGIFGVQACFVPSFHEVQCSISACLKIITGKHSIGSSGLHIFFLT